MTSHDSLKSSNPVVSEQQLLTDAELMAGLAAGNRENLGILAQRHQDLVFRLAWRMLGDRDMAEDISQEAFLRVYQASKTYRPDAKFTTWLYRIAVNLCLDEKRRARRSASVLSALQETGPAVFEDHSQAKEERQEQTILVRQAIDRLNPRQRLVLLLHRFDGLRHDEIALVTGWSQSAVESLLVRAYKKLRKELDRREKI